MARVGAFAGRARLRVLREGRAGGATHHGCHPQLLTSAETTAGAGLLAVREAEARDAQRSCERHAKILLSIACHSPLPWLLASGRSSGV